MYCPGKKLYVGMVVCIYYLPSRKTDYKRLLIILVQMRVRSSLRAYVLSLENLNVIIRAIN